MSLPGIEIKTEADFSLQQLHELYNAVGWTAYTKDPVGQQLLRAIQNSTYVVSAWVGRKLVGLARGLSDDVSIFYLQDILVHPDHQEQGIGTALLKNCLKRFQHVRTKVLLTDDDEVQLRFYKSLGYTNTNNNEKLNAFIQVD
jgi:ribosomal protein S18 acetylase RimI-like enzyme